jgi:hypothetical protein
MKKTSASRLGKTLKLSAEYKLDYKRSRPSRVKDSPLVVVIDPDVARVFTSAEQVNKALRAIISAMPEQPTTTR